jgi:hypothetical protein
MLSAIAGIGRGFHDTNEGLAFPYVFESQADNQKTG